jgi:hypothetical protein
LGTDAKPGLLVVIGMGCLAGAAALAWFSSIQTLQLRRTVDGVDVLLQARLFGVVTVSEKRLEQVRSVATVTTIPEVSRPRPFTRLLFETSLGSVDLWSAQSPFLRWSSEITAFFDDSTQREATFSSRIDGRETARFVVAQLSVLSLALCGSGLFYLAARSILGSDRGV